MNPLHSRLLLVGSSARSRLHLRAILNELSITQIDEANDGHAALALHRANAYDLIVSEWDLPQLSGIDLLRAVRKGSARSSASFILMTAEQLLPRTIEALHAGVTGLMELPLVRARTMDKLKRVIEAIPEQSGRGALRAADLWSPTV